MTHFAESYALWLADYYLLATVFLALALAGIALLKQPAQRLMVTKSTLVALVLLAILCAVPGWSVVHLLAADRPPTRAESVQEEPMSHADAVGHPELSQANPVQQAEQPAVLPQAADETLIKPIGPKMSWSVTFAIAHLAGMGCIAVWLALGWVASVRLRKTGQTPPANISAILSRLASNNSRASQSLQLFAHDRIDVAVALGVWRPMILLPTRWTSTQSHDRLQAVLAHESTHILNHDLQWVALTRALFVPLWANPLFWLTKRRLRLDQEALADAAAAEITSRQRYAEQLVAWAREARSRPALHLSSAVGLWEGPSQLRQRVAILLDEKLTVLRNCSRRWRIATALTLIAGAAILSLVTIQPAPSQAAAKETKPNEADAPAATKTGALTMRFEYDGVPPEPKELKEYIWPTLDGGVYRRIDVEKEVGAKVFDESLVVGKDRGIANVFVWVRSKDIPNRSTEESVPNHLDPQQGMSVPDKYKGPPVTLSYSKGRYEPHALAFDWPRQLRFRNDDPKSAAGFASSGMTHWVSPLLKPGEERLVDVRPVSLPVHMYGAKAWPWLSGWVLPMGHPYFAVSDEHGKIRIENLPPGKWEFQTWHEKPGYLKSKNWPMGRFTLDIKRGDNDLGTVKLSPELFNDTPSRSDSKTSTGASDEKQSTPASGEKKDAKPKLAEMDTLKVAVVDANDQPIKGAKVKPYGMRSNNDGSHYGWFGENEHWGAQETTTDDEGIAVVRYPRNVDEEKPVTKVSLQVSHTDFVATRADVPIGGTPSKVRMQHGGVVEITVAGREKPNIEELFGVGGAGDIKAWTRTKDGKLRSPHLAEQNTDWTFPGGQPNIPGQDVRVVWVPKNGPPQFSNVEHVQIREGETQSIEVRLKPGVKLAGSLAADVPRPIVGGRVVVNLDTPGYTDWRDWAPVNEDGTFEFASLPSDDEHDLQIMAYCEGSISTTGAEDGTQLKPQKLRLTKDMSDYVVEMEPTATAVVKLLDPNGKPVPGAKVAFSPNIFWSNGSNIVNGPNYRSRDSLLDPEILNKIWKERPGMAFQATTDEQGVAKVDNLPAYPYEMMQVFHDQFQLPIQNGAGAFRYFTFMKLSPGGTAEETITLERKRNNDQQKPGAKPANNAPAKGEGQLQPSRQPIAKQPDVRRLQANTIIGRVVDEKGQPIPAADVFLFRINRVDRLRKLQAKTTADAEGKYRFENVIDIPKEFPDGKLRPLNMLDEEFVQVFVRAPGRTTEMRMDLRQSIATGTIFDMKLSPAAKLTGRITGPDGKPVGGALVSVGGSGSTTWEGAASTRTKADGAYVIDDVPPYGVEEYHKKAADEKRRLEAFRATSSQDSFAAFVAPPMITVAHPDFATKTAIYNKIPGAQDVQLEPAAIIEGRAVLGDPSKPAVGVLVKLNTSTPQEASSNEDGFIPNFFAAEARTDADGKYRFASLPAGNYDLSAEKRNWVNQSIEAFAAAGGKTSAAPNLILTPGGIISIRLINDKTGKPIPIGRDTRADISAHLFPLVTKGISHPSWVSQAAANPAGRFELHAPPGKRAVFVGLVYEGEQTKWINKQSRTLDPKVVDVVEGKTVEVDIPVIEMPKDPAAAITGRFQAISPVKVPDEQPKKSSSDDAANKPDKNDGANTSTPKPAKESAAATVPQPKATELTGRVDGPDGKPLAGATVDVWTWHPGNETRTDELGRFSLKGFEPGEFVEVEVRKPGFEPRHFVDQRTGTPDWVVKMDNKTYLEGQLTDPAGKFVAGAVIRAERGPFQNVGVLISEVATETQTDETGHYRLYLEPDRYDIKVRVPDRGVARFEKQQVLRGEGKPFDIHLEPGATFHAVALDSVTGKPVQGIVLWNWRLKGIEGTSTVDGLLDVPAMYPGKFEFSVSATGEKRGRSDTAGNYARWWSPEAIQPHQRKETPTNDDPFQRNFDELEFKIEADSNPVTIYVEPGVTITGRVIDPDGKPVAGATVAPAKTGSGNSLTGDTRYSYTTKKDGTFEMKLPASGAVQYNLVAHDGEYEQWRNWANGTGQPFATTPGDHLEKIELRLTRPATIRGRAVSSLGDPIVGKEVRAADAENHDNRYYVPTTKTDDKGNFELKFVGPGKHYIQVDPFFLNPTEAPANTSTVIDVKEGETIDDVKIGPQG